MTGTVFNWLGDQDEPIPGTGLEPLGLTATLRVMEQMIVTLDGPAGSGKSTVARLLAQRLDVEFLDTGAMYRGITAVCLDAGCDPAVDAAGAVKIARQVQLHFDWKTDPPRLFAGGRDLTDRLRDPDVTTRVSPLAALGPVRQVLVDAQRRIGRAHPRLVTEGRDQGSVVFPQAQAKFYLDAAPQVRARRRAEQLRQAGRVADEAQILQQILERDDRDAHRADGPLICPPDAMRLDTSDLTLPQVVERLEQLVRQRVGDHAGTSSAPASAGEHPR